MTPRDGDGERRQAADRHRAAVLESRAPVVYATLIILVALVPLLFVAGGLSAFLPSLAVAYGAWRSSRRWSCP